MKAKAAAMSKEDNEKVAKNPAEESGSFGGSYLALLIGAVAVGLHVAHLQT